MFAFSPLHFHIKVYKVGGIFGYFPETLKKHNMLFFLKKYRTLFTPHTGVTQNYKLTATRTKNYELAATQATKLQAYNHTGVIQNYKLAATVHRQQNYSFPPYRRQNYELAVTQAN